jgi:hypothetical protein
MRTHGDHGDGEDVEGEALPANRPSSNGLLGTRRVTRGE